MVVIQRSQQTCNSRNGTNNSHTTTGKNIEEQCENHTSTTDNKVRIKDKTHPSNNGSSSSVVCVITRAVGQAISSVIAAVLSSPSSLPSSTHYSRSCHTRYFILIVTLLFVSLVLLELNSTIIITHAKNNTRRDRRDVVTTVSANKAYHHAMVDTMRNHFRLETAATIIEEENKKNDDNNNNNNNSNMQDMYDIPRHEQQQQKKQSPRVFFLTGDSTTFASTVNNIIIRRTLSDEKHHQKRPYLKPKRYTKKSCVPISEWQTAHTPTTCNDIHALPLLPSGGTLINRGSYRDVWIVADSNNQQQRRRGRRRRHRQPLILKMALYYKRITEDNHARHQRESLALSQMSSSSSKHIMKLYANCATSAVVEYGDGPDLERFMKYQQYLHNEQQQKEGQQQKSSTTSSRLLFSSQRLLELVRDVAMGLAEAHLFRPISSINNDNNNKSNITTSLSLVATLAHTDIKPSQFVSVNGTFKLGDFNRCIFLTWDDTTHEPCPFDDGEVHRGRLRSPEEYAAGSSGETTTNDDRDQQQKRRNKTEKIDIYAMGNIFYYLLTGGRYPFEDIAISGKKMQLLIIKGERSPLPVEVEKSEDDVVRAVVDVMRWCWASDPNERPTALEVVDYLRRLG